MTALYQYVPVGISCNKFACGECHLVQNIGRVIYCQAFGERLYRSIVNGRKNQLMRCEKCIDKASNRPQ